MKLTFRGFLQSYCQELAGVSTSSLRKLVWLVAGDAPRLAEPLFLFAMEQGNLAYLLKVAEGTGLLSEYEETARLARPYASAELFCISSDAPSRYRKVYDAFCAKRNGIEVDRRVVGLMRDKTLTALAKSGMTRYRLCKNLGLNMGNVYAYLTNGDVTKVSRSTARAIMEYAQSTA